MSDSSTVLLPPETPGPPPEAPEPPPPAGHRRRLTIVMAAVALLVLATPVAVFLLRGHRPAPSGPSATPSLSATAPPSASASASPNGPAPDGRIDLDTLKNATLDIPAWPADNLTGLSGRLTFVNGEVLSPPDDAFYFERHIVILYAAYGDIDGDGAQETIATIGCVVQGGSEQLVAFDRDAAGKIVTMGVVVATTGQVRGIDGATARVLDDGMITVRVGDYQPCCGDQTPVQFQDRGYRWNGSRFGQVSGPVAFPANPNTTETGLQVAREIVFGPARDGWRTATLRVTVSHQPGTTTPDHLSLTFSPPEGVQLTSAPGPVRGVNGAQFTVDLPNPPTSASYTFEFRRPAGLTGGEFGLALRGKTALDQGDDVFLTTGLLREANPYDNDPLLTVRETN